jgi:uncharacterized protein
MGKCWEGHGEVCLPVAGSDSRRARPWRAVGRLPVTTSFYASHPVLNRRSIHGRSCRRSLARKRKRLLSPSITRSFVMNSREEIVQAMDDCNQGHLGMIPGRSHRFASLRLIKGKPRQEVALIILPAFALQLIVGIACIAGRDAIAATLMASFAGTWLADSLFYLFGQPGQSPAQAVFFFTFCVFIVMLAIAALPKAALFAVLVVAAPRFFVSGLAAASGNADISKAAGSLGFLLAAVAMYTAFALLLEDVRGHTALPIGRSGPAREAIEGTIESQIRGYEHMAGIRRTL